MSPQFQLHLHNLRKFKAQKFEILKKLKYVHDKSRFEGHGTNPFANWRFANQDIDNLRYQLRLVEEGIAHAEAALASLR